MYRIDDATAAGSIPTPEAAGTEGYFTEGNPATGTPATKVRGSWLNMIQEELCAILAAAGITRSKTTYNQVNSALQKLYSPVIGSARNVSMSVTAASATATLTADEIVVGAALGGQKYMLSSFNKTINLATTGAGGMDTGTAPVSGFVAIYAIYNPTTGTAALLAKNCTASTPTSIYNGANMPSGYTASALDSIWRTNGSGQFVIGCQQDREINVPVVAVVSGGTATSYTSFSLSAVVPLGATSWKGNAQSSPSVVNNGVFVAADANGTGLQSVVSPVANQATAAPIRLPIITAQTGFYQNNVTSSTSQVTCSGYSF
jgi:hypothetical protein